MTQSKSTGSQVNLYPDFPLNRIHKLKLHNHNTKTGNADKAFHILHTWFYTAVIIGKG